jgi:hypothetical protein
MTCLLTKLSFSKFRLLWQTADHEQGETIYYELNKLPATVRNVPLLVGCKNDPSRVCHFDLVKRRFQPMATRVWRMSPS